MEVYNLDQALIKKLIDTGYQHFSLSNGEGKKIVSFNPQPKDRDKKIDEIKKRFAVLPDGLYQLLVNWKYGGAGSPDVFLLKKGTQPIDQLPAPIKKPLSERSQGENVLSYESALENIKTISELEAKVRELESENKRLSADLEDCEKELAEATATPLGETGIQNNMANWLKDIAPMLAPLGDRYFDIEKKKLDIAEREQYYKYNPQQIKKPTIVRGRTRPQTQQTRYPDVNDPEALEIFFNELDNLPEDQFNKVCEVVEKENPALYEIICAEFSEETEETEK